MNIEEYLFFDTFLEKPYGLFISIIHLATNRYLYHNYIVLPDYKWGVITDDTIFKE